ncbi:MAG: hypothetical protein JXR44_04105 [Thiotrichales bacterium]|nr:hypothetical protein [Thiotrichales bacterium]
MLKLKSALFSLGLGALMLSAPVMAQTNPFQLLDGTANPIVVAENGKCGSEQKCGTAKCGGEKKCGTEKKCGSAQ